MYDTCGEVESVLTSVQACSCGHFMAEEPPKKYNFRISDADWPMMSFNASTVRKRQDKKDHQGPLRVVVQDLRDLSFFHQGHEYNYSEPNLHLEASYCHPLRKELHE